MTSMEFVIQILNSSAIHYVGVGIIFFILRKQIAKLIGEIIKIYFKKTPEGFEALIERAKEIPEETKEYTKELEKAKESEKIPATKDQTELAKWKESSIYWQKSSQYWFFHWLNSFFTTETKAILHLLSGATPPPNSTLGTLLKVYNVPQFVWRSSLDGLYNYGLAQLVDEKNKPNYGDLFGSEPNLVDALKYYKITQIGLEFLEFNRKTQSK